MTDLEKVIPHTAECKQFIDYIKNNPKFTVDCACPGKIQALRKDVEELVASQVRSALEEYSDILWYIIGLNCDEDTYSRIVKQYMEKTKANIEEVASRYWGKNGR